MRIAVRWAGVSLSSLALQAQSPDTTKSGQINGVVRDSVGRPIPNVEVSIAVAGRRQLTGESGQFQIRNLSGGVYVIVARKVGFFSDSLRVALEANGAAEAVIVLRTQVLELRGVQVTASMPMNAGLEGFERRRARKNGGQFITREQIERRRSIATTDVLRGVSGIKMVDSMGVTIAISSRGDKLNMLSRKQVERCVVRVGVDGYIKDPTFGINEIPPRDIHGIEVYAGAATIPIEFNSSAGRNAQCGLIMIWTRTR